MNELNDIKKLMEEKLEWMEKYLKLQTEHKKVLEQLEEAYDIINHINEKVIPMADGMAIKNRLN